MNKEQLIDEYVRQVSEKIHTMSSMFTKTTSSDRKHMENGFRYAITSSIEILKSLLEEKPNKFKEFVDKTLGWKVPTQEDIDAEKAKIEMAKQKLELSKIRSEMSELKKNGGDSPFASFVKAGNEYSSSVIKKKKNDEK